MPIVRTGVISNLIEEELAPAPLLKATNDADPVFASIEASSFGVMPDTETGRGYLHIKTYKDGIGGASWWQQSGGPDETSEPDISGTVGMQAGSGFPGRRFMRYSTNFRRQLRLVQAKGNITLPEEYFRADQLSATIAPLVMNEIEDVKERMVFDRATTFYSKNVGSVDNVLATVGAVTALGSPTDTNVTFTLGSGEHVRRMYKGQMVELWDAAGAVRRHSDGVALSGSSTNLAIVDSYDPHGNTLKIALLSGTFDTQVAATDLIIALNDPTNSGVDITSSSNRPASPYGFQDVMKASGALWTEQSTTGVDLSKHQMLQSIVKDFGGNVITDQDFHQLFARHDNAVGAKVRLDTIITGHKVINGYLDFSDDQATIERNGVFRKPRIGFDKLEYVFSGTPVEIKLSRWIDDGQLVAMKLKDQNWRRMVRPRTAGSNGVGSATERDGVEFVLSMSGSSIFRRANEPDGSVSDFLEAPWVRFEQRSPSWPQGILCTNLGGSI